MKTTYETRDGKTFTDLGEANEHERLLNHDLDEKLTGAFGLSLIERDGAESDAGKLRRLCDKSEMLDRVIQDHLDSLV